jgi:hypothetical protein
MASKEVLLIEGDRKLDQVLAERDNALTVARKVLEMCRVRQNDDLSMARAIMMVEMRGEIAETGSPLSSSDSGVNNSPPMLRTPPTVAFANGVDPYSTTVNDTNAGIESASISLSSMANFLHVPRSTVVNGGGVSSITDKVTAILEQAQPAVALWRESPVLQHVERGGVTAEAASS